MPCPILSDLVAASQCENNYGGIAPVMYLGLKEDLNAPLAFETGKTNVYAAFVAPSTGSDAPTPTFKTGKGLYKIDLKENSNGIKGGSLGRRKGFQQTLTAVIDGVNEDISLEAEALNNLDYFIILKHGDKYQIMYDPDHKIYADSDGINTDTGVAPSDDCQTNLSLILQPVSKPNFYITAPTGGFDAFLASAQDSDNEG